ncbi:MAG: hypothetical protein MHPSP_001941, partial [Paramarteilia canceri]
VFDSFVNLLYITDGNFRNYNSAKKQNNEAFKKISDLLKKITNRINKNKETMDNLIKFGERYLITKLLGKYFTEHHILRIKAIELFVWILWSCITIDMFDNSTDNYYLPVD